MALETNRKMSVRRITAPGDSSSYVDLKIIDSIIFIDPKQHYQEWELSFENNPNAARKSRVVEIGEDKLKVERIDALNSIHNAGGRWQEWSTEYENGDETPVHYKTHKRKIYHRNKDGSKDKDIWVEVQRIDAIWFKDPKEHNQERVWELVWPDNEDEEWDYQGLTEPVKDWDGTSINPPWRLDPFQTIVDCNFNSKYCLILYGTNRIAYFPTSQFKTQSFDVKTRELALSSWDAPIIRTTQLKLSNDFHALAVNLKFNADGTVQTSALQRFYNVKDKLLTGGFATKDIFGGDDNNYATLMNGSGNSVWTNKGEKITWSEKTGFSSTDLGRDINVTGAFAISSTGQYYSGGYVSYEISFPYLYGVIGYEGSTGLPPIPPDPPTSPSLSWSLGDGSSEGELIETNSGAALDRPTDTTTPHELVRNLSGSGSATAMKYRNDGKLDYIDIFQIPMSVSTSIKSRIYIYNSTPSDEAIATGYFWYYREDHQFDDAAANISFGSLTFSSNYVSNYYIEEVADLVTLRNEFYSEKGITYAFGFGTTASPWPYWFDEDVKKHNQTLRVDQRNLTAGTADESYRFYSPYGELTYSMNGRAHSSNGRHVLQLWEEGNGGEFMHLHLDKTTDIGPAISSAIGANLNSVLTIILDVSKSEIDQLK